VTNLLRRRLGSKNTALGSAIKDNTIKLAKQVIIHFTVAQIVAKEQN